MTPEPDDEPLTGDSETTLRNEIEDLRAALDAIRTGGVDAVMIPSPQGDMLYTLTSADRPYRVIVEEMGEGAATISERGILLYANQRFADLLRRDRRSLIGRDLADVLQVGDPFVLPSLFAAPPGATTYAELDLTADDGSTSPVLASVSGLDLDGVVVRCLVIADLTHRKRVEQQLADANTKLSLAKTDLEEAQRVAHLGSWLWDRRSGRVQWSPEMCAIFDIEVTDDALAWPDVLAVRSPPEDAMELMTRLHAVARDGGSFELSQRLLLPVGTVRQVLTRGEAMRDDAGEVTGVRGTMQDVTSLRRAEVALAQSTAQFVAAFEYAPVGMAVIGLDRTILSANRALGEITGYDVGQLTSMRLDTLMDPRDAQAGADPLTDVVAGRLDEHRSELRLIRADGARRWVSISAARIGAAGTGTQAVLHVEDITDRKGYESGLVYLADHDPLTGLANRRRFREDLEHYLTLATRAKVNGALLLLDLDNFKDINDTFGHPTGDGLLCAIADVFRSRVRQSDVIARLGGDEFAILLWAVDVSAATTAALQVLDAVRDVRFDLAGQRVRTTASAGLVMLDGTGGRTADEVISNADLTMYAAKDRGRDGLVVFEPQGVAAAQSRARFHWTDQIHRALDEGLFTLLTQPILDLKSGQITGCELLLRMRQGDHLVAPEEFLGIAERHGLAAAIDTHVVRIGT
ncbi:diguanylate cyclase domain-containing protein, partial [Pengzhenrongella sp.]|uniref:diguanylate cyclase domain-containing protein n=1 Tax=Pengzhenrongella sp. TaxID=2888820 RepID=UPI002F944C91